MEHWNEREVLVVQYVLVVRTGTCTLGTEYAVIVGIVLEGGK